ncbi:MAG: ATP-binding domain-containing protein [Clostridia bacterium]|nr:ATP-binding domain-containing protein [Clostridia bacterium]
MDIAEFAKLASKSAQAYLDFARKNGKGREEIGIISVAEEENNIFKLRLSKKVFDVETTYFVFNSPRLKGWKEREDKEGKNVHITEYDETEPSVTVSVEAEFYSTFKSLKPEQITLVSDLTFLIEAARDWYEKHGERISFPSEPKGQGSLVMSKGASDEQIDAVNNVLKNPASYVWGAPGTGKTQMVLASCIASRIGSGAVLVAGPTNNAVEQSLYGIISMFEKTNLDTSLILRMGNASREFSVKYPELCERSAITMETQKIKTAISILERRISEYNFALKLAPFKKPLSAPLEARAKLAEARTVQQDALSKLLKQEKALSAEIEKIKERLVELKEILTNFQKYKDQYNASELKDEYDTIRLRFPEAKAEMDKLKAPVSQLTEKVKQIEEKEDKLARKIAELVNSKVKNGKTLSDKLVVRLLEMNVSSEGLKELENKLKEKHNQLEALKVKAEEMFNRKRVFACTVDYLILHYEDICQLIKQKLCHIFIDEAAYCSMIKSGPLFSFDLPVGLFGDHMQLPPVCEMENSDKGIEDNDLSFLWSQSSLYFPDVFDDRMGEKELRQAYFDGNDPLFTNVKRSVITNTYRFGDNLAQILNKFVYKTSFHGVSKETEIIVIDAPRRKKDKEMRQNSAEADAIKTYIKKNAPKSFAILTPYKKQRDLIQKALDYKVEVSTIHASQGREWDTVIMSVVDTDKKFFTDSKNPISKGLKIINTAISRAKRELVIVCDREYWFSRRESQLIGSLVANGTKKL